MSAAERKSQLMGGLLAVVFHAALVIIGLTSGMKYLDPPPAEKVLIEFEQLPPVEKPKRIEVEAGVEPKTPAPAPEKPVKLVQQSKSPVKGTRPSESVESTTAGTGDVEVNEPKRETQIDRRALFSSAANNSQKDTVSQQVSANPSNTFQGGNPTGNTRTGATSGAPSAQVAGRSVVGSLPLPEYRIQEGGTVVVDIVVDGDGHVISAQAGGRGTTLVNSVIWKEAEAAALKAQFNKADTKRQEGTITYNFRLK